MWLISVSSSQPPPRPKTMPMPNCAASDAAEGPAQRGFPAAIIAISVMVRNTAIGSLLPDSISSGALTRSFAFAAQQREDRGGIGGTDNGADQQALQQIEIEQPWAAMPVRPAVITTPTVARQRRPQGDAERADPGAHAAVEQDHRQREVADRVSDRIIAEDDAVGRSTPANMPIAVKITVIGIPSREENELSRMRSPPARHR